VANKAADLSPAPEEVDVLSSEPGAVARISREAAQYGQEIGRCAGVDVASRLYRYNTAPLSPAVRKILPTSQALDEHLGMSGRECLRPLVTEHWMQVTRWWQPGPWSSWVSRAVLDPTGLDPLVYKLYISPRWEHLGEAVRRCLPILTEIDAPAFKWGRELTGILRPDKFVVYFRNRDSLRQAAKRLLVALGDLPAQGVPFTAEVGGSGLLSWAKDHLPCHEVKGVEDCKSWRQWVSGRLAEALMSASPVPVDGVEPWELALERLLRDGVDPQSWTWVALA
jgi:hypothetical protein